MTYLINPKIGHGPISGFGDRFIFIYGTRDNLRQHRVSPYIELRAHITKRRHSIFQGNTLTRPGKRGTLFGHAYACMYVCMYESLYVCLFICMFLNVFNPFFEAVNLRNKSKKEF